MRKFVATGLTGVMAQNESNQIEYMEYMSRFGKSYSSIEEFNFRLSHFTELNEKINEHNEKADQGEFNFWVGHNKMTDWS